MIAAATREVGHRAMTVLARPAARRRAALLLLGVMLAVAVLLSLGIGAVSVPPAEVVRILASWLSGTAADDTHHRIIVDLRLPRVLLAGLVGAGLSIAGAAFQGLFRNPMADPFVIGVSGGAALGAALAVLLGLHVDLLGFGAVPVLAFAGAVGAVVLVHGLAGGSGRLSVSVMSLLLAGVAVAALTQAVVSLLVYLSGERLRPIVFWQLGSLGGATWTEVGVMAIYAGVGFALLTAAAPTLNALLLGEEAAHFLGIHPGRARLQLLAAGALMTAAAVSVSGVIGFVGLIVPHGVRLVIGSDHRGLLPAAALAGSTFLVICDTAARSLIAPAEIPLGIFTALAGAPFFLYLLRRHGRSLGRSGL
ncbi:MAG TPA: iron chelate uptake ABC transporter family permease subunit [Bacillota bacterium]